MSASFFYVYKLFLADTYFSVSQRVEGWVVQPVAKAVINTLAGIVADETWVFAPCNQAYYH